MENGQDPYAILGVRPDAEPDEITKAYKKQALRKHPDKNPGREVEAQAAFDALVKAYETLKEPLERARYDATQRNTRPRANGGPRYPEAGGAPERRPGQQAGGPYYQRPAAPQAGPAPIIVEVAPQQQQQQKQKQQHAGREAHQRHPAAYGAAPIIVEVAPQQQGERRAHQRHPAAYGAAPIIVEVTPQKQQQHAGRMPQRPRDAPAARGGPAAPIIIEVAPSDRATRQASPTRRPRTQARFPEGEPPGAKRPQQQQQDSRHRHHASRDPAPRRDEARPHRSRQDDDDDGADDLKSLRRKADSLRQRLDRVCASRCAAHVASPKRLARARDGAARGLDQANQDARALLLRRGDAARDRREAGLLRQDLLLWDAAVAKLERYAAQFEAERPGLLDGREAARKKDQARNAIADKFERKLDSWPSASLG